jgi:hypothetical protein
MTSEQRLWRGEGEPCELRAADGNHAVVSGCCRSVGCPALLAGTLGWRYGRACLQQGELVLERMGSG